MQSSPTIADAIAKLGKPCQLNQEQVNKNLSEVKDQRPNVFNKAGHTAVHEAIFQANPKALRFVLNLKSVNLYVETTNPESKKTPLMMAVSHVNLNEYSSDGKADSKHHLNKEEAQLLADQTECLRLVINYTTYSLLSGPTKEVIYNYNTDAAVEAFKNQNFFYINYYVNYLQKMGKRIYQIHKAAEYGVLDLMKRLFKYKAEVKDTTLLDQNIEDSSGNTALTCALIFYFENKNKKAEAQQIIDELLKNGAMWRAEDLLIAAIYLDLDCLKLLIEDYKLTEKQYLYTKSYIENQDMFSLLTHAAKSSKEQIVRYLAEKGFLEEDWEYILKKDPNDYPYSLFYAISRLSFATIKLLLDISSDRLFKNRRTIDSLIKKCDELRPESDSKQNIVKYLTFLQAYRDRAIAVLGQLEEYKKAFPESYTDFINLIDKIEKKSFEQKESIEDKKLKEHGLRFLQLIEEKKQEGVVQKNPHALLLTPSAPPAEKSEFSSMSSQKEFIAAAALPEPISQLKTQNFSAVVLPKSTLVIPQHVPEEQPGFFEKEAEGEPGLFEQKAHQIEGVPDSSASISIINSRLDVSSIGSAQYSVIKKKSRRLEQLCVPLSFINSKKTDTNEHSTTGGGLFSLHQKKEDVVDEKQIQQMILRLRELLASTFPNPLLDIYQDNENMRFKTRQLARARLGEMLGNYSQFSEQIMQIFKEFSANKIQISLELPQRFVG